MSEFSIPIDRPPIQPCAVTLVFQDRQTLSGTIPLLPDPTHPRGITPLARLLNSERRFLPFEPEDKKILLVARQALLMVKIPTKDPAADLEIPTPNFDFIHLHLLNGDSVSGTVSFVAPPSDSRMSDFFNRPEAFVPVEKDEHLLFISKSAIATISFWETGRSKP